MLNFCFGFFSFCLNYFGIVTALAKHFTFVSWMFIIGFLLLSERLLEFRVRLRRCYCQDEWVDEVFSHQE